MRKADENSSGSIRAIAFFKKWDIAGWFLPPNDPPSILGLGVVGGQNSHFCFLLLGSENIW